MASRTKRTLKQPRRFVEEFVVTNDLRPVDKVNKPRKDNELYDIEVCEVNRERKMVRIHFKGYDSIFDEWRPYDQDGQYFPFVRRETPHVLTANSLSDRGKHFIDLLYRAIKRSLSCGRKDDPEVRLEVDVLEDVFNDVLGNLVESKLERRKYVHVIPTNNMLNNVLGQKWDERIVNIRGDFCFVAEGTVKYWLSKKSNIVEYKLIGGKYAKTEIEGCCMMIFTFVRGTGNKVQYEQRG